MWRSGRIPSSSRTPICCAEREDRRGLRDRPADAHRKQRSGERRAGSCVADRGQRAGRGRQSRAVRQSAARNASGQKGEDRRFRRDQERAFCTRARRHRIWPISATPKSAREPISAAGTITCNYDGYHKHRTIIGKTRLHRLQFDLDRAGHDRRRRVHRRRLRRFPSDVPADALAIARPLPDHQGGLGRAQSWRKPRQRQEIVEQSSADCPDAQPLCQTKPAMLRRMTSGERKEKRMRGSTTCEFSPATPTRRWRRESPRNCRYASRRNSRQALFRRRDLRQDRGERAGSGHLHRSADLRSRQ